MAASARKAAETEDVAVVVEKFQEVIKRAPKWAEPHVDLGRYLASKGRTDEAIVSLKKGIALDPSDSFGLLSLGYLLINQGKRDDGLLYLRKVLKLKHWNMGIFCNLAFAFKIGGAEKEEREAKKRIKDAEGSCKGMGNLLDMLNHGAEKEAHKPPAKPGAGKAKPKP